MPHDPPPSWTPAPPPSPAPAGPSDAPSPSSVPTPLPATGGGAGDPIPHDPRAAEVDRLRSRRDNARWSAVVGFLLLFGGSFNSAFLAGGVAMIAYGALASMWWSAKLRKVQGDPWEYDPELDGPKAPAWSREGRPPRRDETAVEMDEEP